MTNNVEEESRCALNYSHLKDISENRMLNNNIMSEVQKMLKKPFTEVNGLQIPVLGQGLNFQVYRSIPFVQLLHNDRMHWVAISTYGCDLVENYLMDSLFNGRFAEHTKKKICSILNCAAAKIKVNVLPVVKWFLTVGFMALHFAFIS